MKFKTASFTRLLVLKTNLDTGAGLDTKWHVTVSLYNFSHMRAHTHICRPTHTVPALQTHTHTNTLPLCVSPKVQTHSEWLQSYTHTGAQSTPMPLEGVGQHSRLNSFTSCAGGESYWRNILYTSRPRGSTTTHSTWLIFTLALHFVLDSPLLPSFYHK